MCGIAGFWLSPNGYNDTRHTSGFSEEPTPLQTTIQTMGNALTHRGPDDAGVWWDDTGRVAFAHRRLSILDLSPTGHQPMTSANGRYTLVFNGEIFNHLELRHRLQADGHPLRGTSDTEALLEHITHFGLDATLALCNGFFAFAISDAKLSQLTLVRDRMGVKPLYWAIIGDSFVFGSELKAIMAFPGFDRSLNQDALGKYFAYGYVPETHCIFTHAHKLQSGHILTVNQSHTGLPKGRPPITLSHRRYWEPTLSCPESQGDKRGMGQGTGQDAIMPLLQDAVELRRMADVPVGCFLSGGVDSSLVAALLCQLNDKQGTGLPLKTFSVAFEDPAYNEGDFAQQVAEHLGTDHYTTTLTPQDVPVLMPTLTKAYDEPFADSSQLAMLKVSALAKNHVKVVLTGDGGDEAFGGYNRHTAAGGWLTWWFRAPPWLRTFTRSIIHWMAGGPWGKTMPGLIPKRWATLLRPERFQKLSAVLEAADLQDFYQRCTTIPIPQGILTWPPGEPARELRREQHPESSQKCQPSALRMLQLADLTTYLPGDILTKLDRATMAHGLEGRSPFIDYRVVSLGLNLPDADKVRRGRGKVALRNLLSQLLPRNLINRPKTGFGVPLEVWLTGPLASWVTQCLSADAIPGLRMTPLRDYWTNMITASKTRQLSSQQAGFLWRCLVWIEWWHRYGQDTNPSG